MQGLFVQVQTIWGLAAERRSDGKTSPEELIAAAHASCFSMALSGALAQAGTPPERLKVRANATLDAVEAGLRITTMDLEVWGRVPGLDLEGFLKAAEGARTGCPVSNALTGVEITLKAYLEEE